MKYCAFCNRDTIAKRSSGQILIGILLIFLLTIIGGCIYLACCDKKICSLCGNDYIESSLNFQRMMSQNQKKSSEASSNFNSNNTNEDTISN